MTSPTLARIAIESRTWRWALVPCAALLCLACEGSPSEVTDAGLPDQGPSLADSRPGETGADGSTTSHRAYAIAEALAGPTMEGRQSGTRGGTRAAEYLASRLAACGLEPFGDDGFFQSFEVVPIVNAGKMELSTLAVSGSVARAFDYREEWRAARTSPGADLTAHVAFAGYGLVDPKHDDYAGLDPQDRIVVALGGCPSGKGALAGCDDASKAVVAAARRAVALILVATDDSSVDRSGGAQGTDLLPIPTLLIKQGPAADFLPAGTTLGALKALLAAKGPQSVALSLRARLVMPRTVAAAQAHNVLGVIRSPTPRAPRFVLAGAHYDHLGIDEPPSSYFPGALDNASGTAVVVDAACRLAASGRRPPERHLVFALWAAEEDGLIGSTHFVSAGQITPWNVAATVNLDMVGGTGTGPAGVLLGPLHASVLQGLLVPVLERPANQMLDTRLGLIASGGSDHVPFMSKKVPTVYIMGPQPRLTLYHTLDDTMAQLSPKALDLLGSLLAQMMWELAATPAL